MAQNESSDDAGEDQLSYYAILNIPRDASDDDVRRAYRNLAQVFHPDKHTDESLKEQAKEAFAKLQEAYEVLSDPNRRQVYDVYGSTGLAAGFEVGSKLKSREELRKQWEEFKKKQEADRNAQLSNHRGLYVCRMDLSDMPAHLGLAGLFRSSGSGSGGRPGAIAQQLHEQVIRPLFRSVTVTNSIDTPVGTDGDVFYMQGQAALRGNAGAGNLVFGYRRVLSPHDTLEGNAVVGLRSALSVTSTRQVTPYTSCSLTTSWAAGTGVGMQVASTRQLPYNMQATLGWTVGPSAASSLSLSLTKRGTKYVALGKLDLGVVTSLMGRLSYSVRPDVTLRAIARLSAATGVDLELGALKKWGSSTSGYMGCVVGLQGVMVKGRLVRGGQTFEVPVVVSHHFSDWRAVAASYVLPPLTYYVVNRCVVRPLLRWQKERQERESQREHAEVVRESRAQAAKEASLIEPVARRRARSEAAKGPGGGLVILDAVYGSIESYVGEDGQQQKAMHEALAVAVSTASAGDAQPGGEEQGPVGAACGSVEVAPAEPEQGAGAAAASGSGQAQRQGKAAGDGCKDGKEGKHGKGGEELHPWLRVTCPLQYLVSTGESKLVLHPGIPKAGLMGFADPLAPGSETVRRLYVAYQHGGKVYECTVDEQDGLVLPGAGEAVADEGRRRGLLALGGAALGVPELLQGA